MSDAWEREVVELHDFFEAYFRGTVPTGDVDRMGRSLAADFTIAGPSGSVSDRDTTLAMVADRHGALPDIEIWIEEPTLLAVVNDVVVGSYVEAQRHAGEVTRRLSTVVMSPGASAPNGLVWHRVHETWISDA